ncbi:diguanylate cyclase [Candidatus Omnitrophota bacterium]
MINLSLGLFVLFKDIRRSFHRLFFFFSLSQAIWWLNLCGLFYLSEAGAASWNKIFQLGFFFIAPTVFHFFVEFLENKEKVYKWLLWFSYGLAFSAVCITWMPRFETRLIKYSFGYYPAFSRPADLLHLFNLLLCLTYAVIASFKKYRITVSRLEKRQLQYLFFGIAISILSGYVAFLGQFDARIYPSALAGQVVYICFIFYAILQHRLWNLDVVINKIFFSLLLFGSLVALHTLSVKFFAPQIGYLLATAISSGLVIFVLVGTPYRRLVRRFADTVVYRGKYDYRILLSELAHTLVAMLDLESLLNYVTGLIVQNIGVKKLSLLLEDPETGNYILRNSYGLDSASEHNFALSSQQRIVQWLLDKKEIFVKEEMEKAMSPVEFKSLYGGLGGIGAELIIPLIYKDRLVGILNLDQKLSGSTYDQGDIDLLTLFADETAIAVENARLYLEAITDGLTKLYHHTYFMNRLNTEFERANRHSRSLSLLMIDFDHFKDFNDNYGHRAGDTVLRSVAGLIKSRLRAIDIAARYGGEELSVILPETALQGAMVVAEQIRKKIEEANITFENKRLAVTVSIGIASFDGANKKFTREDFIKQADKALYDAKKKGRNRTCVFKSGNQ